MCSGKTTLGQALAKRLSMPFYDLDEAVEREAGMSVADIFATRGESSFRNLEAEALTRLASEPDAVIACGGGTPCRQEAWQAIRACGGYAVWLKPADTDRLMRRLIDGRHKRPLIAGLSSVEAMSGYVMTKLKEREMHYAKADAVFDSSYLENAEEINASVDKFIDLMKQNGK